MRKPVTYNSIEHLLENTARTYRRALWDNQNAYVEIWIEKDALAGVVYDVCREYDVPLMVVRGYGSISFLHGAAEAIKSIGKPTHLYYFGDRDPTGVDISRKIETDLRGFAPDAEIHFERVAVTEKQIQEYKLPTRPTKRTDPRAKTFKGESVELDAIAPNELRRLVRGCIESHIEWNALAVLREAEASEREWLRELREAVSKDS
jgi:hypothetical protein